MSWNRIVPKKWATKDVAVAAKLAQYADDSCRAELEAAAARIKQEHDQAIDASRAAESSVELLAPEGLSYLPYQRAGIARAASIGNVLIADEMGLGKTIQAIGVVNSCPEIKSVLVICPASLKLNWQREFERWLARPLGVERTNISIATSDYFPAAAHIMIVNYDIVSKLRARIDEREWDLLVCDECHYCKNSRAIRTKAILGRWDRDPEKIVKPIAAKRRIMLTGTPIVNRPIELWPLISSLDPKNWKNMMYFAKRYCAAVQNGYGWDMSGASNLSELQDKLRSTIMIRRLKADVLKELPAKRRQVIEFSANGASSVVAAEAAAWQSHEDEAIRLRALCELSKTSDNDRDYAEAVDKLRAAQLAAFTDMARIRHQVAMAKVPKVVEFIHDLIDDDAAKKIVVMCHHHDVEDAIYAAFGAKAVLHRGGLSDTVKQDAVDRFQRDASVRLFVGSIKASGVGITLVAAAHVIFAELDWTPGNLTQAEDRCHRIGQTESVIVQHLVLEGSLDARMARILVEKQEVIREALDDEINLPEIPQAPIGAPADKPRMVSVTRKEVVAEAPLMSAEEITEVHGKLQIIAGMCDGAFAQDGSGFNKFDSPIGKALAECATLTPKQAVLAKKLVNKYRRQLA